MDKLKFYRDEIDKLDKQIMTALSCRLNLSRNVGVYKKENNLPVLSYAREDEILKKTEEFPYSNSIKEIYAVILKQSKLQQE